ALADRDQPRVVGGVLVGAGAAGRDQAEDDVAALARPAGDAAGDRELVVVRMRRDAEDAREVGLERVGLALAGGHEAPSRYRGRASPRRRKVAGPGRRSGAVRLANSQRSGRVSRGSTISSIQKASAERNGERSLFSRSSISAIFAFGSGAAARSAR